MGERIRIISDIHFGHKASLVKSASALRPLGEGADKLIFNGDTVETKYTASLEKTEESKQLHDAFRSEIASWGLPFSLITGNHDPDVSEVHFETLLDGQVLITHGDGIYDEIAPWSSTRDCIKKVQTEKEVNQAKGSLSTLHDYLAEAKDTSRKARALKSNYDPTILGKIAIFLHQLWPPMRTLRILEAWRQAPSLSVRLAKRFGYAPHTIIIGHNHYPCLSQQGKTLVINTGSFFPWPGALAVDIEDRIVSVRQIRKGRKACRLGKAIHSYSIPSSEPTAESKPDLPIRQILEA